MHDTVIFCTSCLADGRLSRYQDWIDYYTEYFTGAGVDLWMVNDGPESGAPCLDLKGVRYWSFPERLGRPTFHVFPGWKRSFGFALALAHFRYRWVAHIESDLWLTPRVLPEFIRRVRQEGYYVGWAKSYGFPEASLQILNSSEVRQEWITRYLQPRHWHENLIFENLIQERFRPIPIFEGDRYEGCPERALPHYTYLAQASLAEFRLLYPG